MRFAKHWNWHLLLIISGLLLGGLLLVAVSHWASVPLQVELKACTLSSSKEKVLYEGKPLSGQAVVHHANGQLSRMISFRSGIRHGWYRKYFPDGALSFEVWYRNGKQEGRARTWWSNGKLRSAYQYRKGVVHGLQQEWYKSGALFKQTRLQYGQEQGLQQSWRQNGKIYNNYEVRNGRIYGLRRSKLCFTVEGELVAAER